MMKVNEKRVNLKTASKDQESTNTRKKFHDLQQHGTDKENLVGRPRTDLKAKNDKLVRKCKKMTTNKSVQVEEAVAVTAEDLTSEETNENYWRLLAEKRGEALDDSFKEIESLKDEVETLKDENKTCKEMLNESKILVEVLQEMIEEGENSENEEAEET